MNKHLTGVMAVALAAVVLAVPAAPAFANHHLAQVGRNRYSHEFTSW